MGTGPPIRAEASMLGGDPAAGLYMLLGVIAITSGVVVTVLCMRKREKTLLCVRCKWKHRKK